MTYQDAFLATVAARKLVRPAVRAIVVKDGKTLVQRPVDDPAACFAFIGGEYEHGDTFDERVHREFEEETNARVIGWRYLFVVENRFNWNGELIHGLEHYLEVEIDRLDVESRVSHLVQHWLPVANLREYDLRPHAVRDAIADRSFREMRHLLA
jgi:ADP-ribose pyrophosphatase YjhB (NUDIX family)